MSIFYLGTSAALFANVPGGGSGGANVTVTDNGSTVVLANGIVTATITKTSAEVSSLKYKGFEMIDPKGVYWSMDGGTSYQNPSNCVYTLVTNTSTMVDVSCKHFYASGDAHVVDIDVHYVLRQGNTGLYVYAILSHPASYAALSVGEWRMVMSIPKDPANTNNWLMENIYVDNLRHWQAPSPLDLSQATTQGIKEVVLLNSGVRNGQFECKYEYAPEYYKVGTYGWASNVNKIGEWFVLGNYEYFNDGPPKQDLGPTSNGGGMLLHFGRNHFGGSSTNVPAGQSWSKIYGPFLIYLNTNSSGADSCWTDAKNQVYAEASAWPYTWLTTSGLYPQANSRGIITGHLIISDPLKPSLTGSGAWVGVTDTPAGTNWQSYSEGYQYWVQADSSGNFTIPDVRPGNFTLSAYVTGAVGEYTQTNVTVTAGQTKSLGNITWVVPHPGQSIAWEIGIPDRRSAEFFHGSTDYYTPYLFEQFHSEFPNPLIYTVGTSNPATNWNYCQAALWQLDGTTVAWPWHINFNLSSVPSTGNAVLTLAMASANQTNLNVYVNDSANILATVTPVVNGGNALLREVEHAKYDVEYVTIPVSKLKVGANTIILDLTATTYDGNHIMYDYLNLEMPAATQAVVANPSFNPAGGSYTATQSVSITSATSGASIRYTTDGSTPTSTTGTVYSSALTIGATTTLKAIAYKSGDIDSSVTSATYTISIPQTAAPTFSPAGGSYTTTQSVSITSATTGASIRYTIDGSTPTSTTGSVYSGAISIGATTTLKAIAYKSGDTDSTVTSAVYTITPPAPVVVQSETGTYSSGSVIETTNAGWTGTGYVNSANLVGAYSEVTVSMSAAGTYHIDFRYANGTTVDRPADLSINGTVVQTAVSFPNTGAWTTWSDVIVTKALVAGANKIRLTATTANGDANLDKVTVSP